jgi:hypothetical protein
MLRVYPFYFAIGGEWGGALLLATEYAPPDHKVERE